MYRFFLFKIQKRYCRLFLVFIVWNAVCLYVTCTRSSSVLKTRKSFRTIQNQFNNPPKYFRPLSRWIWNGPIHPEAIDFQLREFDDKNLGGVIIYPDTEMQPGISSEAWQDMLIHAKAQAESLGMSIWVNKNIQSLKKGSAAFLENWPAMPECYEIDQTFTGNIQLKKKIDMIHQSGENRVTGALFRKADPGLSFREMKETGDQAFVFGFDAVCFAQSLYSICGLKQYKTPTFSYQMPWWDLFPFITTYFSRLSLALSTGMPARNILVLLPSEMKETSLSIKEQHDDPSEPLRSVFELLKDCHVEFDLGVPSMLDKYGSVENGVITTDCDSYSWVILSPGVQNLASSTLNILERFLKSGGKVVYFEPPVAVNEKPSGVFQTWPHKYRSKWIHMLDPNDTDLMKNMDSTDFSITLFNSDSHHFLHRRRHLLDGQILFLVNISQKDCVQGCVRIQGEAVYRLDAFKGTITRYPSIIQDQLSEFDFDLKPSENLLVFSASSDTFGVTLTDTLQTKTEEAIPQKSKTMITPGYLNSLVLNRCDILWDGKQHSNCPVSQVKEMCSSHPFKIQFNVSIHESVHPLSMMIVIPAPDAWNFYVNNKAAEQLRDAWLLDHRFGVYSIGSCVKSGMNTITLIPSEDDPVILPVYIYGDFSVTQSKSGWILNPPRALKFGHWQKQGMPFYSDDVSYTQTYFIQKPSSRYKVKLGSWQGTVTAVQINDFPAGIIAWPPFSLDVTEYLRDGLNDVEVVVYGSLENMFPSDDIDLQRINTHSDSFYTSGLFESFKLLTVRQ